MPYELEILALVLLTWSKVLQALAGVALKDADSDKVRKGKVKYIEWYLLCFTNTIEHAVSLLTKLNPY